jgi:hypothetical protein
MGRRGWVLSCFVLAACSVEEPRDPAGLGESEGAEVTCIPGEQRACACPGDAPDGVQVCEEGGSSLGPCMGCPGGSDGGSTETGADGTDGTDGPAVSTTSDGGSVTTSSDDGGSSDEWGLPPEGPPDAFGVVEQVAMEHPEWLLASCVKTGGNNEFLFEVVRRLRMIDPRWGLNWKRGMIGDLSQDVVDYHFGEGEPEESTDVFIIDIIVGHCGDNPQPGWIDVTLATLEGGTIGMWTLAGQDL